MARVLEGAALVLAKGETGRKPGLGGIGAQRLPTRQTVRLGQWGQNLPQQIDHGLDIAQRGMGAARGQTVILAQGLELAVARRDRIEQPLRQAQGAESGPADERAPQTLPFRAQDLIEIVAQVIGHQRALARIVGEGA